MHEMAHEVERKREVLEARSNHPSGDVEQAEGTQSCRGGRDLR